MVLALNKMQKEQFRIWIRVIISLSFDDSRPIKFTSQIIFRI